jgi:hypothetical protein
MEDINEKLYTQGFNHGYLLAQHEPDLAHLLAKRENEHSDYFQGIIAGQQEYDMEKIRENIKGVNLNQTPGKDIAKDMDKER